MRCAAHTAIVSKSRVPQASRRTHDPGPKGASERREEEYLKQAHDSRTRQKCQASGRTRPLGVECRCRPRAARFLVVAGRGSIAWPSLGCRAFRNVFVFAPSAPAIQVFIPTMGAFDRRQLIVEFGHSRLASCRWGCNGNDNSARPVLTQPPDVAIPWNHLRLRPEVDMARRN